MIFDKIRRNLIAISIIVAGVIIAGALLYAYRCPERGLKVLSPQEAAKVAIDYINQRWVQKGSTASLMGTTEENGVYKIHLKIGAKEYDSYVTKNGKLLFPEGYSLGKKVEKSKASTRQPKKCEDIKKADAPVLEVFVVSKCPFGLQMQRILNEIVKNIPSLADNIKVEYIGAIEGDKITSMHGDEEAQENLRQICLREEQSDKYWSYISCHIKKGDVDGCLKNAGIDKSKLDSCTSDNSRGLKYAKKDFDSQGKYKVTGSPTLILNGERVSEFDFGGRTAQGVKTLLCCGFKKKPGNCSQKLTESSAATGFSETYSKPSGSSGGKCK